MNRLFAFSAAAFLLLACVVPSLAVQRRVTNAICVFEATGNNEGDVSGYITFTKQGDDVAVSLVLDGVSSNGTFTHHVHQHGNLRDTAAALQTAGHFLGCTNCRPDAVNGLVNEVGLLNDGASFTSNENGQIRLDYVDTVIALNGDRSIIGRSVVVHEGSPRIAQCVIGRNDGEAVEGNTEEPDAPAVSEAICHMSGASGSEVNGWISFEEINDSVKVRYFLTSISQGYHGFHVHEKGNIWFANATLTGGHFYGTCEDDEYCRPEATERSIGFIGDGHKVVGYENVAASGFMDTNLTLNGIDSIIGRSIVLHDPTTPSIRIGQCVVGISLESADYNEPSADGGGDQPLVLKASAYIYAATDPAGKNGTIVYDVDNQPVFVPAQEGPLIAGIVDFTRVSDTDDVFVSYTIHGLPSETLTWYIRDDGDLCPEFVGNNDIDLNSMQTLSSGGTVTNGFFTTDDVRFRGNTDANILGRTIAIYHESELIAYGVVGIQREHATLKQRAREDHVTAVCHLQDLHYRDVTAEEGEMATIYGSGYVTFTQESDHVRVKYEMRNIPPGNHTWHVHTLGDIIGRDTGLSVSGHFVGNPDPARTGDALNEVGNVNDGKMIFTTTAGNVFGSFKDYTLELNGENSIIGRSIIVHGDGNEEKPSRRVAACTIGAKIIDASFQEPTCASQLNEVNFERQVMRATCSFQPTSHTNEDYTGSINFVYDPSDDVVTIDYNICDIETGSHAFHVHTYGELFSGSSNSQGGHFKGFCPTDGICRPGTSLPDEVGLILDGAHTINNGGDACATANNLEDSVIKLNGPNSIIGRSIVIHRPTTGERVANCVIGRDDDEATEEAAAIIERRTLVERAVCDLRPINDGPAVASGFVALELQDFTDYDGTVDIRFGAKGLADGSYKIYIHQKGDVSDLGNVFDGDCTNCGSGRNEVGDTGIAFTVSGGVAHGYAVDSAINLNSYNTVVGRTLVIKADSDNTDKLACVIGVAEEGDLVRAPVALKGTIEFDVDNQPVYIPPQNTVPYIRRGSALLRSEDGNDTPQGVVDFIHEPTTSEVLVRGFFHGLTASTTYDVEVAANGNLCGANSTYTGETVHTVGTLTTDSDGHGRVYSSFEEISLGNHTSSVIGRRLVVRSQAAGTPVVSSGVIGRAKEDETYQVMDVPYISHASCKLKMTDFYTDSDPNKATFDDFEGYISFSALDPDFRAVRVKYYLKNAPEGSHGWHIHNFGDVIDQETGLAVGGHYVGDLLFPRPEGIEQEIGELNDGRDIIVSSTGVAYGEFKDENLFLNGENSIIGRSIIIHGYGGNTGVRIAQCVIGVASEEPFVPFPSCDLVPTEPAQAKCVLEPTTSGNADLSGEVNFVQLGDDYQLTYSLAGFSSGTHTMEIHEYGNSMMKDASAIGDVFGGICTNCRPGAPSQSVGYINNGNSFTVAAAGTASGVFFDDVIRFKGENSIVGRSLIVKRGATPVAMCIVGISDFVTFGEETGADYPDVTKAVATVRETGASGGVDVGGRLVFEHIDIDRPELGLKVTYFMYGAAVGFPHEFHIHTKGDLSDPNGNSVEDHFPGTCNNCRPTGVEQTVGRVGNGFNMESQDYVVKGYIEDEPIRLNGPNSIIGRGFVFHGDGASTGTYVGYGVVGILEESAPNARPQPTENTNGDPNPRPKIMSATCSIRETSHATFANQTVQGWVRFERNIDNNFDDVVVTYTFFNLPEGAHTWHVHERGDLCQDDGQTVGGHFVGNCNNCRPPAAKQEIGLLNDGVGFTSVDVGIGTYVAGRFIDDQIQLEGENSIVGRSIIIHGNGADTGVRVAQCVIGVEEEHPTQMQEDMPPVYEASCQLRPTYTISPVPTPIDLNGHVRFVVDNTTGYVDVRYRVENLPAGLHNWYVYQRGNVLAEDTGNSTGSLFEGPTGVRSVGLLNGGLPIKASSFGTSQGSFEDKVITLNGASSIIGRSLVITGDGDNDGTIIATCVIGINHDDWIKAHDYGTEDFCPLLNFKSDPSSASEGLDSAEIAIISVASIGGLLILLLVAFICCGKRGEHKPTKLEETTTRTQSHDTTAVEMGPVPAMPSTLSGRTSTYAAPAEGALPPNWALFEDDDGNPYYYNSGTGESTWERPTR